MGSLLVLFLSGVVVILGTIRSCPAIARFADAEGFDLAEALNARGVRAARGGRWHATTVRNLLVRQGCG